MRPLMTPLHGLACICLFTLMGITLGYVRPVGYVPAVKKLATKPHWPPPRYQKKAANVLRLVAACNTTCPLVGFSERKLQNVKTNKTHGEVDC